jgi:hypothetical protein
LTRIEAGGRIDPFHLANSFEAVIGYECQERSNHPFSHDGREKVRDSLTVIVNDSAPTLGCRRPVDDHVTDVKVTTNDDDVTDVKVTTKDDHGKSDDRDRPGWSCRWSAQAKSLHQHSRPTNTLPGCPRTTRESTADCLSSD